MEANIPKGIVTNTVITQSREKQGIVQYSKLTFTYSIMRFLGGVRYAGVIKLPAIKDLVYFQVSLIL